MHVTAKLTIFPGLPLQEEDILYLPCFSTMRLVAETGWEGQTDGRAFVYDL
jgi:hypothetical protein